MDTLFDPIAELTGPQPWNKYHRNSDKILKYSAGLDFGLHL
jgi:hypothetical protein